MQDYIFRQYDIRGKVGIDFAIEDTYAIAQAIGSYIHERSPNAKTIVIGRDGRTHSPILHEYITDALIDSGFDVVSIGVCPTPVLYFAEYQLPVDASLMITASHNGPAYNGIKITLNKQPVAQQEIQYIKELYKKGIFVAALTKGTYREQNMIEPYIDWLTEHFDHLKNSEFSCIIDCGNGAAGTVLPLLLQAMGWSNIALLYETVDGTFPHHEADPTVLENMTGLKSALATNQYSVGFGLDGDCDRMALMIRDGSLILGDKLLALFARSLREHYKKFAVVFDIKCSRGLPLLLQQWGVAAHMSPCGHSFIKRAIEREKALLGGELSCHFFFCDRYFGYDDGIYALLRTIEILQKSSQTVEQMLAEFPVSYTSPEFRITVGETEKWAIVEKLKTWFTAIKGAEIITIDGVLVSWPFGWGLIRASNTQPAISLRFEAESQERLIIIKELFCQALEHFFDGLSIRKHLGLI